MSELIPALVVVVIGSVLAALQASGFSRRESPLLMLSFVAHLFSAIFQIWFTRALYGWGDLFGYSSTGESLAVFLRDDFFEFAPDMVKVLFHQVPPLPFEVPAIGSSTGAMVAIATFVAFLTGGSFYTLGLAIAVFGYFGKVALYRAFRSAFPPSLHRRLIVAILLIPSSIFWSSAMLKEAVAICGLGYLVWGMTELRSRLGVIPLLQAVAGAAIVAVVKAYILFPVAIAAGVWLYAYSTEGGKRLLRPVPLAAGVLVGLGGVTALGKVFPQFAVDSLAEWAAYYQDAGTVVTGGSTYSFGDPSQATLTGQLAFAPLALITSLFRPFLFEARSAQVAVNGLETAILLVLWIRVFARAGARRVLATVVRYPMLTFSLTFSLCFGVAVGLTTTNLGTLSRYRMPLVPFFWALLLVIDAVTAEQPGSEGQSTWANVRDKRSTRVPVLNRQRLR